MEIIDDKRHICEVRQGIKRQECVGQQGRLPALGSKWDVGALILGHTEPN